VSNNDVRANRKRAEGESDLNRCLQLDSRLRPFCYLTGLSSRSGDLPHLQCVNFQFWPVPEF
jgi:hypothetical protein